jgi:hypothetical protein
MFLWRSSAELADRRRRETSAFCFLKEPVELATKPSALSKSVSRDAFTSSRSTSTEALCDSRARLQRQRSSHSRNSPGAGFRGSSLGSGVPGIRHQVVDKGRGPAVDEFRQNAGRPGERVDAVEFARLEQRRDDSPGLGADSMTDRPWQMGGLGQKLCSTDIRPKNLKRNSRLAATADQETAHLCERGSRSKVARKAAERLTPHTTLGSPPVART